MIFKKYESKKEFLEENLEILLRDECLNETMIGILMHHDASKVDRWLLGRIENNSNPEAIFLVDDDNEGLLVYFVEKNVSDELLEFLIQMIVNQNVELKNIVAPLEYSEKLVNIYLSKTNKSIIKRCVSNILVVREIQGNQILREDEKLVKLDFETANLEVLANVVKDICIDINKTEPCSDERALEIAKIYLQRGLYILTDETDDKIFCHVVTVRKLKNGITLGAVISPRKYRGQGYGKKCVYGVCKKLLEENDFIVLHVADSNEIAKNIYKNIGFEEIGTTEKIYFE